MTSNKAEQDRYKQQAALAAIQEITPGTILGVGTGSTVNFFIDALADQKIEILGAVASSVATEKKLRARGIPVVDINEGPIPLYVDGADECNDLCQLIKGGGAALTREKILASIAQRFVCIIDASKHVKQLGTFPLPIEVIPMARSYVAREMVKLGGDPVYREGCITDNGNQIIDIHNLTILEPIALEETINHITGVVCHGLFAKRSADRVLIATESGIKTLTPK